MRVFLVSRCSWTFYNFRGGLARALAGRGFDVVGAGAGGDAYEAKIRAMGIPFWNLPIDKRGINPVADLRLIVALYRWYRAQRPDVVHHFTIKPVIYGSIAARLAGVPRIVNTITGLGYVYTERQGVLRWIVDWMYRLALACSHHVFFQNEDDRTLFVSRKLANPRITSLVPGSGVDTERFRPGAGANSAGERAMGAAMVLMVSRVLRDKGAYEFVEAARIAKGTLTGIRFAILGEIDIRNPTAVPEETVRTWHNERMIEWLGHTDEVRPYIAQADIVVLPSYREGTPRSLLEASAMGKPVIATNVVGCREVVEHGRTGLLVPVRDSKALADAIIELVRDPERRARMGAEGRKKVRQEFDERLVIELAIKAYGEAA
jgi:glycosyltransferase involved in cell wall biosynthesis